MYNFGDKIYYNSPVKQGLSTECVFIREDNGKAIIMFPHAERTAIVCYENISTMPKPKGANLTVNGFGTKKGKTNFIAENAIKLLHLGASILLISTEMTPSLMVDRINALDKDRDKDLSYRCAMQGRFTPIFIPFNDMDNVIEACQAAKKIKNIDYVLYDHISDYVYSKKYPKRADVFRVLQTEIVDDMGINVIATQQLYKHELSPLCVNMG